MKFKKVTLFKKKIETYKNKTVKSCGKLKINKTKTKPTKLILKLNVESKL